MKKIILSVSLIATSILFASTKEKKEQISISKQKRIEITKTADKTVYFWEVTTVSGYASGYTVSEAQALRTLKLMTNHEVVSYKIIEAYKSL